MTRTGTGLLGLPPWHLDTTHAARVGLSWRHRLAEVCRLTVSEYKAGLQAKQYRASMYKTA